MQSTCTDGDMITFSICIWLHTLLTFIQMQGNAYGKDLYWKLLHQITSYKSVNHKLIEIFFILLLRYQQSIPAPDTCSRKHCPIRPLSVGGLCLFPQPPGVWLNL